MAKTTQVNILVKPIQFYGTPTKVICGIDPKGPSDVNYVVGGVIVLPELTDVDDDYELNFEIVTPNPLNFTEWHVDMFACKADQCPSVGNMNGQFKKGSLIIKNGKVSVKVAPDKGLPPNKVHYALYFASGTQRIACDPIILPGGRWPSGVR